MNHDAQLKQINLARRGGEVLRFHTHFQLKPEKVSQHTFNLIGILLACVPPEHMSVDLLAAAHVSDIAEAETGDIPSPIKRSVEGLREAVGAAEREVLRTYCVPLYEEKLSSIQLRMLKLADSLDGALHCVEELMLGNQAMYAVLTTYTGYCEALLGEAEAAELDAFSALFDWVTSMKEYYA